MSILDESQRQTAIQAMRDYLSAPAGDDGQTPEGASRILDEQRVELIETQLKPLLARYLSGDTPLVEFKSRTDGINKRNPHWGFKGIKGQMFFNMVVNACDDLARCDRELKVALTCPADDEAAKRQIRAYLAYVKSIGDRWVVAGNTRYGAPKPNSIPFFLSYFWQIQDRTRWPVYYTNGVNTLADLNLWQPSQELAEDYITFKQIHHELASAYSQASGQPFDLYQVEHVFWFKGGNPYEAAKEVEEEVTRPSRVDRSPTPKPTPPLVEERLPDSYVPPIVAILPRLARREDPLVEAARRSGNSIERTFEKSIHATFTVLGYETTLLGQGSGRAPDGLALSHDHNYAIIWDAKSRGEGYAIGTDDRTIREYISTQSRDLKRRRTFRNVYYAIVSSAFTDDHDDVIRAIKMETDVSEVILVEAEALVAMVDVRLRAPLQVSLGPDGIQRLLAVSGILTAEMVKRWFN